MKLKIALQISTGAIITWFIIERMGSDVAISVCLLTPFLGLMHELFHYLYIKMLKVDYKFTLKGMYIGFHVTVNNVSQLIATALVPQVLTISLLIIYAYSMSSYAVALALYHMALSSEDMWLVVKYLPYYFS